MVMRLLAAPLKPETAAVSVRRQEGGRFCFPRGQRPLSPQRNLSLRVGDHMMPWSQNWTQAHFNQLTEHFTHFSEALR